MNDSIPATPTHTSQGHLPAADTQHPQTWHALPQVFRRLAAHSSAVLLETAKPDGDRDRSLLFLHPIKELIARAPHDLDEMLHEVDRHLAEGFFVAGFFAYECGEHFVGLSPRPSSAADPQQPLAWLGIYANPIEFDHRTGITHGTLPHVQVSSVASESAVIVTDGLQIARDDYDAAIASIHRYLQEGHTYQVNFTDKIEGSTDSAPLAVYETLLRHQPVPFAAYLNTPTGTILSFSPELFYRTTQGRITVRPMKGTWPRGVNVEEDDKAHERLQSDEKNRSEHVMIVDLLRNDLGRICTYGSVHVDHLFQVERYNTLLQMTSTCSGQLRNDVSPAQVLAHLFPSGSITGAPKRRTMEIIRELEHHPREVYTGCIGFFAPQGEAVFNVAIRTLQLEGKRLTMGVGGGITADSKADEEYEECRLKAEFLTRRQPSFSLFETMRCTGGEIPLLPLHMQRLAQSASYFDFPYDEHAIRRELVATAHECGNIESKVRLELSPAGACSIAASPLEPIAWSGRLLLAEQRTRTTDVFLHHKTTHRDLYARTLARAQQMGFDEVLFLNERGELTEGAISNLFLCAGDRWLTPCLQSGVLPGVQRTVMLAQMDNVEERALRLDDLARTDAVFVCNALRGLREVVSIEAMDGSLLWQKETA